MTLNDFLEQLGYVSVPLRRTPLGHLELDATVNGKPARLLVDTGASGTVIDKTSAERFAIQCHDDPVQAVGCGFAAPAEKAILDELRLADLEIDDLDVSVVDLSQINAGLEQAKAQPIDGIIGSNIMIERNGIIEYASDTLHLRRDAPNRISNIQYPISNTGYSLRVVF